MLVKVSDFTRPTRGPVAVSRSKSGTRYSDVANVDTASTTFSLPTTSPILDGLVNSEDELGVRALCRDMFMHDPICGGAAELYAGLPFGQFSLSGMPELEMIQKHQECLHKIKIDSLFTPITLDYLVDGSITGALNLDMNRKIVDAYIPLNLDFVTLQHVPVPGENPLMDIVFPTDYRKVFSNKTDERVKALINRIPQVIRKELTEGGKLELNPELGIFVPRGGSSTNRKGISMFRTLLPYWILEKALLRGTIQMAYRRQRGILVIQMGSDTWPTTEEEMAQYVDEVILADRDPHGAVIALRHDVSFQEIRNGGDFWKHGDTIDVYNQLKLKALGLSDSAFSGDSSVGAVESVMTIFNQRLRGLRENTVRGVLTDRIFPIVSKLNDYTRDDNIDTASMTDFAAFQRGELKRNGELVESYKFNGYRYHKDSYGRFVSTAADEGLAEGSNKQYYIPAVNFHASLRPEASQEYMGILTQLTEMGVPIPLRTVVGATGLSIGDILAGKDEDVNLHKTFADYRKQVDKYKPKPPDQGMGGGGDFGRFTRPASARSQGLLSPQRLEQFEALNDLSSFKANGNRLTTARGRKVQGELTDRKLAEAAVRVAMKQNFVTKQEFESYKERRGR